jgi:hypothetical protein
MWLWTRSESAITERVPSFSAFCDGPMVARVLHTPRPPSADLTLIFSHYTNQAGPSSHRFSLRSSWRLKTYRRTPGRWCSSSMWHRRRPQALTYPSSWSQRGLGILISPPTRSAALSWSRWNRSSSMPHHSSFRLQSWYTLSATHFNSAFSSVFWKCMTIRSRRILTMTHLNPVMILVVMASLGCSRALAPLSSHGGGSSESQPQWWRRVDLAFVQSGWHEPR